MLEIEESKSDTQESLSVGKSKKRKKSGSAALVDSEKCTVKEDPVDPKIKKSKLSQKKESLSESVEHNSVIANATPLDKSISSESSTGKKRKRKAKLNPREPGITTHGIVKLYSIHCSSSEAKKFVKFLLNLT